MCKDNCIFCKIVAGKAEGHCLVIPKRHVPWWHDLTKEETESPSQVAKTVANKIMLAFQPDFVCMYARGRRIPHTHIFLVPTFKGDPLDRFFNAREGFQEAPPEMMRLREKASMERAASQLREKL